MGLSKAGCTQWLAHSQISTSSRAELKNSQFSFLHWETIIFLTIPVIYGDKQTDIYKHTGRRHKKRLSWVPWLTSIQKTANLNLLLAHLKFWWPCEEERELNVNIYWEWVNRSRCCSSYLRERMISLCPGVISQVPAEMHWEGKTRQTGWINNITTLEEPEEKKWSVSNCGK